MECRCVHGVGTIDRLGQNFQEPGKSEGRYSVAFLLFSVSNICVFQLWTFLALRDVGFNETEYGYLIPKMKGLMNDIIPGLKSHPKDYMVYLGRDENIAISKLSPSALASVSIGVKWDKGCGEFVDLDLGCMMLGVDTSLVDYASFIQKTSKDGSVQHGGDNADLPGVVDKEAIHVNLSLLSDDVQFLAFYLSSFTGKPMEGMKSCDVTFLETYTQRPLAVCDCDGGGEKQVTAILLCLLIKTKTGWYFQNASSKADGLLLRDNLEHLQGYVISNDAILRALTKHRRDSI